ncbi:MAG: leucyl aminopeptidase [Nitrospinae bacterium]|nr:leucyl aminopeptidase [Nitrospinota bacterium]
MKVTVTTAPSAGVKADALVLGVFDKETATGALKKLDATLKGALSRAVSAEAFTGAAGQSLSVHTQGALGAAVVHFVGLGAKTGANADTLRRAAGNAVRLVKKSGAASMALDFATLKVKGVGVDEAAQATVEGILLGAYTFDRFKSDAKKPRLATAQVMAEGDESAVRHGVKKGVALAEAACWARDLVNLPGNVATPSFLADEARKMARSRKIKCTVLDPNGIKKEKMGGLMAVAQGSHQPARFIILEWMNGPKSQKPIVLVGKGLTFDTGGISIKPAANMEEMKGDMSGGAGVMGAIRAAADLNLKVNLVALVPSTENMPGGSAIKPGDVATSLSGVTMEIINTDAEGRLILSDALAYATRYHPDCVVDIATLTGACMVALGNLCSGLFANDDTLAAQLTGAGEATGERLWRLPLWAEYDEFIKSDVADIKNVGSRWGGAITAAAFLKKHVGKETWAHLDVAGTAFSDSVKGYLTKGGVGVGVRTLVRFVEDRTGVKG